MIVTHSDGPPAIRCDDLARYTSVTHTLFVFSRSGFETDCIAELSNHITSRFELDRYTLSAHEGYILCTATSVNEIEQIVTALPFRYFMFARQWFVGIGSSHRLSTTDRISGILAVLARTPEAFTDLFLETPDTNEAKRLSPLCRRLEPQLHSELTRRGQIDVTARYRAHVCFTATDQAYIGYAPIDNSSPWSMGIPRLKMPQGAPSRATLKLEEAWLVLVGKNLTSILRPGMRAVDLGAAPGGWTWALAQRRIYVIAVDNGALTPLLRSSEFVEHVRADGFRFRPQQQVAWLVCDIVAQPFRIAQLIAQWAREGWCQNALFNLKLPMKKRYAEVTRCLDEIRTSLDSDGIGYSLVCKQLYHDRDEVTCYLSLKDSKKSQRMDPRKNPSRRIESTTKKPQRKGAGSRPRKRQS